MNIITQTQPAVNLTFIAAPVRIRPNMWECAGGEIVTGGPAVPGGNLFCLTCEDAGCEHCQAVDMAWITGQLSQEEHFEPSGVEKRAAHILKNQLYTIRPAGSLIVADIRPEKSGSEWLVQRTKSGWWCGCSDSDCEHRLVAEKVSR